MKWKGNVQVKGNRPLSSDVFALTLQAPQVAKLAQPGQFAHILVEGCFLRRPISICDVDVESGEVVLVIGQRGEGTRCLSGCVPGDMLDVIAPLGHGFCLPKRAQGETVLVGGGIGVPPLLYAARMLTGKKTAVLGFRNGDSVMLAEDFAKVGCSVILVTEDGSVGERGFVTAPLTRLLEQGEADLVLSCGPMMMLGAVAAACARKDVPCQVSLEERMACGLGACLVCACKLTDPVGQPIYGHVCKDGPVFDAKAVMFP